MTLLPPAQPTISPGAPPAEDERQRTPSPWFEREVTVLIPGAGLLFLMCLYGIFQTLFIQCSVPGIGCSRFETSQLFPLRVPDPINDSGQVAGSTADERGSNSKLIIERYTGRLLWMFVSGVGMIAGLVALVTAPVVIYRALNGYNQRGAATSVLMAIALVAGLLLWKHPQWHMAILGDALQATISNGSGGIRTIVDVMSVFSSINYAASFALVFGASAVLLPQRRTDADAVAQLDHIASQMQNLRLVLYVGTVQLITAVLRISAASQWMLSFLASPVIEAEKTFNAVRVSVNGGFYTLVMIAVYVPAAAILGTRARATLNPGLSAEERVKELEPRGLTVNFREMLPRLVALLGPLLTGPLGELLKAMTK